MAGDDRQADDPGGRRWGISAAALERKALAADWKGVNATVNRAFTTRTARQFDDMVTEARSIQRILRDAHTELRRHQGELRAVIDKWAARNVRIDGTGTATSALGPYERDREPQPTQADVDTAAAEAARILAEANETDRIAARALRGHAASAYDFDEKGWTGLKDADRQQGIADADAMVLLAAKRDALTDAELRRFHEIAGRHSDNPAFAERFATGLGARGTLEFWRSLADPGGGRTPDGDRAKLLATVQDRLGTTLADASRVDTPAMREWKQEMIALGDDRVRHPGVMSAPYGFQVLSPLLTRGKWDSSFLSAYGERLLEFERGPSGNGRIGGPEQLWNNINHPARLSYPPDGGRFGDDPVAGLLEALGHNPEAALRFFDGSSGSGKGGPPELSNWDYLVDDGHRNGRDWPTDGAGGTPGHENLGHALEAATLGYPYDAADPSIPPIRTAEEIAARTDRLDLMQRVVGEYDSSDRIDQQGGVRESLARMAAGHIDSLNYTMADWGGSGDLADRDGMFGSSRHQLTSLGAVESTLFLRALASDEDSYNTVSAAQQVYGTSVMAAQGDNRQNALDAGLHSMSMHGLLDESRSEAIGAEFAEEKEKRNQELEKQAEWRKFAMSATVGVVVGTGAAVIIPTGAAAAMMVPVAMEATGSAVNTQFATSTLEWLKEKEFDNSREAYKEIQMQSHRSSHHAMVPLLNYAAAGEMTASEVRDLTREAQSQYLAGGGRTDSDNILGR
ncbi:DUF6571 family protein [Streptomyces sp. CAU 1734]|uniref:DUF6571 family protein n=1 Tax=Streptomyces sp. CAU 1734 TaxID=3140360 RepID=UPI00326164A5